MVRVGAYFRTWSNSGGVERVALAIVRGLPDVDWVCFGNEFRAEVPNPVRLWSPPGPVGLRTAAQLIRSPLLRLRRKHDLDLLHVHNCTMLDYDVLTVHGCFPYYAQHHLSERYVRFHPRYRRELLSERAVLERGDGLVITVSAALRDEVLSLYDVAPERVRVVHNGVDLDHFHPGADAAAAREAWGVPEDAPALLFVGNEFERKGLFDALAALPHLPRDARLVVVGGADPAPVRERARRLGVEGRVAFGGFVPDAELPAHYAAADAFVFPTRYEPFGLVILEAMACGTPVVVGDVPGPTEFVQDGAQGRLAPPRDAERIAEAIAHVLERREAMGRAARERAEAFSWARTAEGTRAVYQEALEAKGAA